MSDNLEERSRELLAMREGADEYALQDIYARLVEINRVLIGFTVERYMPFVLPALRYDDVRAAGEMGIWKASRTWQPEGGAKWMSYCINAIRFAIQQEHRQEQRFYSKHRLGWGRAGSDGHEEDGVVESEFREPDRASDVHFLDLLQLIVDDRRQRFSPVERDVLRTRLLQKEPARLHQIGARWGLSQEAVRLKEVDLIKRLGIQLKLEDRRVYCSQSYRKLTGIPGGKERVDS